MSSKFLNVLNRPIDVDAQVFLNATGITNPAVVSAINSLVGELKRFNLWNKCDAIYPFVGRTAFTNKFNLKNPKDTNAAYRITWAGSVTFDNNGITGDGATGWGDTNYMITRQNDMHVSVYIRNNVQSNCAMGALSTTTTPFMQLYPRGGSSGANVAEVDLNQSLSSSVGSITDSRGVNLGTRTASNVIKMFQRGTKIIDTTTVSTGLVNRTLGILARKTSSASDFSTFNIAYASIGFGLTEAESATYTAIINAFQLNLGRSV